MYDLVGGGFHRYSVDELWHVPHFEKMLYDNTELLRNYVHGFQSFVRTDFEEMAREIVGWLDGTMSDRAGGGFYASQDADVGLDDDGDFFTWTLDEVRAALEPEELAFAVEHWGIGEIGDMHHNPARNVLRIERTLKEMSAESDATALRDRVRAKLLAVRTKRPTPFIDRTLYTSWNAMAVRAYLETACVLRMDGARDFALKTLDRLLNLAWDGNQTLRHVIAYGDGNAATTKEAGTLDDYAATVHACIDAWIATGKLNYYRAAVHLADVAIALFYDSTASAFYDTAAPGAGNVALGVLAARRKPLQDAPTPAGNPVMASALLRLEALGGRKDFGEIAADTLESFAGMAEHFGLAVGSYGLALEQLLQGPVQVAIVGSGAEAARLEAVAVARYSVNKTVLRIAPEHLNAENLPEALAETLLKVPAPVGAEVWALVCKGRVCLPPVTTAEALLQALGD